MRGIFRSEAEKGDAAMKIDDLDLLEWLHRYWLQDEPQTKWLNRWRGHVWPSNRHQVDDS